MYVMHAAHNHTATVQNVHAEDLDPMISEIGSFLF